MSNNNIERGTRGSNLNSNICPSDSVSLRIPVLNNDSKLDQSLDTNQCDLNAVIGDQVRLETQENEEGSSDKSIPIDIKSDQFEDKLRDLLKVKIQVQKERAKQDIVEIIKQELAKQMNIMITKFSNPSDEVSA